MRRSFVLVALLTAAAAGGLRPDPARAQSASPLAGVWTLNRSLSEFPPDMGWETHAAVTRNATISAMSRLLCVIEPKKTGGSIRTARCALAQGKLVLVYPAQGFAAVAQTLARAGALELVGGASPVRLEALPDLWRNATVHLRGQTTLF